jgi:hypothetical protein
MPTYLIRDQDGRYATRRRVPDDIRPVLKKYELWKRHGSASFTEAKQRHALAVAEMEERFARARQELAASAPPPALQPVAKSAPTLTQPTVQPNEAQMRRAILDWFHDQERQALFEDLRSFAAGRTEVETGSAIDILRIDVAHLSGPDGEAEAHRALVRLLEARGYALPSADRVMLGV